MEWKKSKDFSAFVKVHGEVPQFLKCPPPSMNIFHPIATAQSEEYVLFEFSLSTP